MMLVDEELYAVQAWKKAPLNVVADRPVSSTRAVAHHRVQVLNPTDCPLRLPVGSTILCAAAGLHSSCAEQLWTFIVNITLVNDAFSKHFVFPFVSYFCCVCASSLHLRP
ncbi:hypothetical protein TNCV_3783481 [Trichonephila clavipes]|nr:hypothetical protein TNCV_3783481 [Trichonephila clavipes]